MCLTQLEADIAAAFGASAGLALEQRLAAGPLAYRAWAIEHRRQFDLIFFDQIDGFAAPPGGSTVSAQTDVLQPIAAQHAEARGCTISQLLADDDLLDDFLAWWGRSTALSPSRSTIILTGVNQKQSSGVISMPASENSSQQYEATRR